MFWNNITVIVMIEMTKYKRAGGHKLEKVGTGAIMSIVCTPKKRNRQFCTRFTHKNLDAKNTSIHGFLKIDCIYRVYLVNNSEEKMFISSIDTLERKLKTYCETANFPVPFDDIIFCDCHNVFELDVDGFKIAIAKRQTWKNILKQFLEMTTEYCELARTFIDYIYDNIPHESMYVHLKRDQEHITLHVEHMKFKSSLAHAEIELNLDDIRTIGSDVVTWKLLKKRIIQLLVFDQDCPVCFSKKVKIMTSCYECHQDVCLSCTIKNIRTSRKRVCPFCRNEYLNICPEEHIKSLLQDYLN